MPFSQPTSIRTDAELDNAINELIPGSGMNNYSQMAIHCMRLGILVERKIKALRDAETPQILDDVAHLTKDEIAAMDQKGDQK